MKLEDIKEVLLVKFLGRLTPIKKSDFSQDGLPSYNTAMRKGLRLCEINREFSVIAYNLNPSFCKCCNSMIEYKKRRNSFCSSSCAATFNNLKLHNSLNVDIKEAKRKRYALVFDEHGKPVSVKKTKCYWCYSEICQIPSNNRKYCDNNCQVKHTYMLSFLDWYVFGDTKSNRMIRSFLETIHGYTCSSCSIDSWNGKDLTLEVEHIDGNSENNSKENVCLICPNCHSQTPTYKGKNRGSGRHARMLRYREGKSY